MPTKTKNRTRPNKAPVKRSNPLARQMAAVREQRDQLEAENKRYQKELARAQARIDELKAELDSPPAAKKPAPPSTQKTPGYLDVFDLDTIAIVNDDQADHRLLQVQRLLGQGRRRDAMALYAMVVLYFDEHRKEEILLAGRNRIILPSGSVVNFIKALDPEMEGEDYTTMLETPFEFPQGDQAKWRGLPDQDDQDDQDDVKTDPAD